jgi:RNA polymerase sigma-70 factor (ECF subfamily)
MSLPPSRGFATTRWTLVVAASRESAPGAREALSQLCELYWPPLYGFARRRGYSIEDAQDLTQAFFARFLEKRDVQDADRQRGRFRSFLLSSFKHFLANQYDREHARKRGGAHVILSLDLETAEAQYAAEPPDSLTPEALYEQQWARGVLGRAQNALRAELLKAGRERLFEQVKSLLAGEKAEGGQAEIARGLGVTEGALRVIVHRLRRRYRELLRTEILATVSDESDVDDEVRYLISVLTPSRRGAAAS